ncbi:MAG: hypothetical protein DRN07_03010 [Thermoplasmata archaeon]|nr:MAG: hypothetical protein DRN07_03010 [Thermoplasmata archaeon]
MKGVLTSGKGRGKTFVEKEEYSSQMREKLGLHPYPGTLNCRVDGHIVEDLRNMGGILLEGFVKDGKTYGNVACFPVTFHNDRCFVVIPEKSVHRRAVEIVAEGNLREKYELEDGMEMEIMFEPFLKKCRRITTYAVPSLAGNNSDIVIFYDAPVEAGRRDMCYTEREHAAGISSRWYRKTIPVREVVSIVFENTEKHAYKRLFKFIEKNHYRVMSPVRKIGYTALNEWQIEVKTTEH